jgi:hypothetical protein
VAGRSRVGPIPACWWSRRSSRALPPHHGKAPRCRRSSGSVDTGNLRVMTHTSPFGLRRSQSRCWPIQPSRTSARLTDTDVANGFANRFAFAVVEGRTSPLGRTGLRGRPFFLISPDSHRRNRREEGPHPPPEPEAESRGSICTTGSPTTSRGLLGAATARADAQSCVCRWPTPSRMPHRRSNSLTLRAGRSGPTAPTRPGCCSRTDGDDVEDRLLAAIREPARKGWTPPASSRRSDAHHGPPPGVARHPWRTRA